MHALPLSVCFQGVLAEVTLAYETWGKLNEAKDNAVLLQTGLSASSHAKSHAVRCTLPCLPFSRQKSLPRLWGLALCVCLFFLVPRISSMEIDRKTTHPAGGRSSLALAKRLTQTSTLSSAQITLVAATDQRMWGGAFGGWGGGSWS
jgi:hypothetical protein